MGEAAAKLVTTTTSDIANGANAKGNERNRQALRGVRAKIIGIVDTEKRLADGEEPGKTQTMAEDPFKSLAEQGEVIEPPFDMLTLSMLPEHSSELGQCVEAMQINIEGFGHRQKSRLKPVDPNAKDVEQPPPELVEASKREWVMLSNFFEYATEESFVEFRKRLRKDLETTGNAYFEVIRSATGKIQSFKHIPSYQMRLGKQCEELVEYERPILELQMDGSVEVKKVKEWRRFRKFVQSNAIHRRNLALVGTGKKRWFKEFGDPRDLHNKTGKYAGDNSETETVPDKNKANEVVHLKLYSARSPYGLPRYVGNFLAIFGDRAAEEINYITFRNNNIPSMLIMCANGQLTQGTIDRIESFVESTIQGSDNYSKFLIIEGEQDAEEGEDAGQLKLEAQPLTKDQHDDALFQNYSRNNQDKIRRAFRLPPIFVGRSDDYTRATAESSRRLADEQVFAPERDEFDCLMNRIIYPEMGIRFHKFKSNSPNTTDNEQLVKILAGAEKTGGMTPAIARLVLADILSQDIADDFPKGFPTNVPFSLTMAEAVKNKADPAEPGQQVTALKTLSALQGDSLPELPIGDPVIKHLLEIRKALETEWNASQVDDMNVVEPDHQGE
ncbi:MAG: phage portal protein [bacterium]